MEPTNRKGQPPSTGTEQLVQRLASRTSWTDLALPPSVQEALRSIALRARRPANITDPRTRADSILGSTGVTALFVGSSSTGVSKAAEALANELGRDLYRVDLSRVVSKYIGDTEKNLNRVFESAEDHGWVLFFDEADALLAKRTDVKDSHDRYANIEISYLLERLEAFSGLAILATNSRTNIDDAFTRRIQHIVRFPDA
jgi:SpoVK/Ycf46/Vps4 family AAA+-type ATPase